ncbi:hypothetical protein [uncultured Roseibium sp.]|uniref:hypothetical protein n=1 Tax=uncultured Roseibium sp. TaxID=1936171 RepID=UPI002634CC92|nr:hypothetical protein [uncultured Roseibium sp.]
MTKSKTKQISRRTVLELSLAGAAGLTAGTGLAFGATEAAVSLETEFRSHFCQLGYKTTEPLGLLTGDRFNGGLRYDETLGIPVSGNSLVVQPAARIDDAARHQEAGVLALFTICGLRQSEPIEQRSLFANMLNFLVEKARLDPARLVFVSTEAFSPYAETNDMVRAGRTLLRPMNEAKAAGDGSGFFAPKDHPAGPGYHSVSIHYPLAARTSDELVYPLAGHLEIADIGFTPPEQPESALELGGIGLERLAFAATSVMPSFEDSRQDLLDRLKAEAERDGKPLPKGYEIFAAR